jgi:hypothetical protein
MEWRLTKAGQNLLGMMCVHANLPAIGEKMKHENASVRKSGGPVLA